MGQLLSQPVTDKTTTLCESEVLSYVIGSCQGWRLSMEDAHCAVEETFRVRKNIPIITNNLNFGKEPNLRLEENDEVVNLKIFGVFDGHGGAQSAKYIALALPRCLIEEFKTNYLPNDKPHKNDIIKLVKNAFMKCDYELFHKSFQSGSTAIILLILNDKEMFVCNTGDSRCILSTKHGAVKNLSFDHKPNNIGELIRIQDAGGSVNMNRVNGSLALSRAFGDFNFKKKTIYITSNNEIYQNPIYHHVNNGRKLLNNSLFNKNKRHDYNNNNNSNRNNNLYTEMLLPSEETQVTVEPEVIQLKVDYVNDEFLVLACDGIWDTFRNVSLVELIRHELSLGFKLDKICEDIIDKVLKSTDSNTGIGFDNMTILIVAVHNEKTGNSLNQWYEAIKRKVEVEKGLI